MKDRTLIILAVLFLTFTISSGVNRSLEVGNQIMGRPMAADLKQLYNINRPIIIGHLEELNGSFNQTKSFVSKEIKSHTELWQEKFEKAYSILKSKLEDKKNIVAR